MYLVLLTIPAAAGIAFGIWRRDISGWFLIVLAFVAAGAALVVAANLPSHSDFRGYCYLTFIGLVSFGAGLVGPAVSANRKESIFISLAAVGAGAILTFYITLMHACAYHGDCL